MDQAFEDGAARSEGEAFVAGLPRVLAFHDRNKARAYALSLAVAAKLVDEPGLAAAALDHVRRFMEPDPHQAPYAALWRDVLAGDPRDVALRLLADTPEGEILRDTQPVIHVPSREERRRASAWARMAVPEGNPTP